MYGGPAACEKLVRGGVTVGRSAFGVVSARIRRALLTNARFYLAGRILSPALIWDNYISSYF